MTILLMRERRFIVMKHSQDVHVQFNVPIVFPMWIKYIDWLWQWESYKKHSISKLWRNNFNWKSNKSLINCEQRRVKKLTLKRIYSTRITYDECDFKAPAPTRLVSAISIMRSYLTYTHFELNPCTIGFSDSPLFTTIRDYIPDYGKCAKSVFIINIFRRIAVTNNRMTFERIEDTSQWSLLNQYNQSSVIY